VGSFIERELKGEPLTGSASYPESGALIANALWLKQVSDSPENLSKLSERNTIQVTSHCIPRISIFPVSPCLWVNKAVAKIEQAFYLVE
jgi:hypothetical protein